MVGASTVGGEKGASVKLCHSFREALVNVPGISGEGEVEFVDRDDEELLENKWYKE